MGKKTILLPVLAALLTAGMLASSSPAEKFKVREYEGMPCMWQNGLPYFTRFQDTERVVQDLSGKWLFKIDPDYQGEAKGYQKPGYDHGNWELAPVPGVWNVKDGPHPDYKGAAWYVLRFHASDVENSFARLYFDGVCFHAKVWLNGEHLGAHSGGYTAWSLDASPAIRPGRENLIAVRVDNRRTYTDVPPRLWVNEKLGWWPYGGIARTARIVWTPDVSINKLVIKARPEGDGKGRLFVSGLVYNRGEEPAAARLGAKLLKSGRPPALLESVKIEVPANDCMRFDLPARVFDGIQPWSPENPALYELKVSLNAEGENTDVARERIGFREFEIRGTKLYLNGQLFWMRGMNRHEDDPHTGLFQSDERMQEDMDLLRELHVNHMRPGHYPNDPRWLDLCDKEGITVIHEIPLYQAGSGVMKWVEAKVQKKRKSVPWTIGGGYPTFEQMNDPELIANAEQQLIEMIERDRNHPSVIMWSMGNENSTFLKRAQEMYERLISVSREFDPERPVTFALLSSPFYVTPLLERTAHLADVLMMNEYYGWYFGKAKKVGAFLDRVHEKYPDKPVIVSEFGAGTVPGRRADPPEKFSEDYQVYLYETQYKEVLARPYVAGTMPWILADFRCPWFLAEHPVYMMNLKGLVSYGREKKAAFHAVSRIYAGLERSGGPSSYRANKD